jgi:aspartate oxidase
MELGLRFHEKKRRPVQQKLSGCTCRPFPDLRGSTGREITRVLTQDMTARGVQVLENTNIYELVKKSGRQRLWCIRNVQPQETLFPAKAVILATGGAAAVFRKYVTPSTQTGDGWADGV